MATKFTHKYKFNHEWFQNISVIAKYKCSQDRNHAANNHKEVN